MEPRPVRKSGRGGFSLVETMVTIGIVSVIGAVVLAVVAQSRQLTKQTVCLSNLKEISHGLAQRYADTRALPADGEGGDLAEGLQDYMSAEVLRCPADDEYDARKADDPSYNSYQAFYLCRPSPDGNDRYILGCPRHRAGSNVNRVFGLRSVRASELAVVTANGADIATATTTADRSIQTGAMQFADPETKATIERNDGDLNLALIYSARMADGTLYSVVRMTGKGKVQFTVKPGSRFEVATPVAIAGVKGTKFTIELISDTEANLVCTEGLIEVTDLETNRVTLISATPRKNAIHGQKRIKWKQDYKKTRRRGRRWWRGGKKHQ